MLKPILKIGSAFIPARGMVLWKMKTITFTSHPSVIQNYRWFSLAATPGMSHCVKNAYMALSFPQES